jgi:protocatechuate 3,4-dioxygenase beta subunit
MLQSSEGSYQGRRLPRPDEEVTDQGLGFDLTTLMNRRRALLTLGAGAAALGIAACTAESSSGAAPSTTPAGGPSGAPSAGGPPGTTSAAPAATAPGAAIPEETQGPFPGDGSNGPDILERSGVVRSDIRTSLGSSGLVAGVPLAVEFTFRDLGRDGRPLTGAAVYIWQCDQAGAYSMYSDGVTGETFLRGVQITDGAGTVRFVSVFPGCYPGRWPHIHFEVYPDRGSITDHTTVITTSQLAFPKDVCDDVYGRTGYRRSAANLSGISLESDMVFRDDSAALQTATMTGGATRGYLASLAVNIRAR